MLHCSSTVSPPHICQHDWGCFQLPPLESPLKLYYTNLNIKLEWHSVERIPQSRPIRPLYPLQIVLIYKYQPSKYTRFCFVFLSLRSAKKKKKKSPTASKKVKKIPDSSFYLDPHRELMGSVQGWDSSSILVWWKWHYLYLELIPSEHSFSSINHVYWLSDVSSQGLRPLEGGKGNMRAMTGDQMTVTVNKITDVFGFKRWNWKITNIKWKGINREADSEKIPWRIITLNDNILLENVA